MLPSLCQSRPEGPDLIHHDRVLLERAHDHGPGLTSVVTLGDEAITGRKWTADRGSEPNGPSSCAEVISAGVFADLNSWKV